MSMWDYEINKTVRSGVSADGIRRLISNGTLRPSSHIQETGSDRWTTVEQSDFGALLRVKQASDGDVLPALRGSSAEGRSWLLWLAFSLLVAIGFVLDLVAPRITSLGDAIVQNTSILHDIDVLLVVAVVVIFVSARSVTERQRNMAEIVRTAELVKIHELSQIRRLLEQRLPRLDP